MEIGLGVVVFTLALGVGLLSGLLGIGGGIILTPLLLYLPSALGLSSPDMKEVAGLTMVQGLFSSASGVLRHHKYGFVDRILVAWMGSVMALTSLGGALISYVVKVRTLEALFALLAIVAAGLMFISKKDNEEQNCNCNGIVLFNRYSAVAIAAAVGFLGGLVGQGGAFILIPLMLSILKLPTRTVLGSSLGIVFFSALAGFIGKLSTGQIDLFLAAFLVAGAIPGAQLGGFLSKRVTTLHLRYLLALLIGFTAIKMWYELLR